MIATRLVLLTMAASAAAEEAHATTFGAAARGDTTFTTQGITIIIGLFALLVAVITCIYLITSTSRRNRRENEADAKKAKDEILEEVRTNRKSEDDRFKDIEGDLVAVKTRMERFLPGDVIDGKIEHLKLNRQQVEDKHERDIREISANIRVIERQTARLEERHDGSDKIMVEMKQAIKDLAGEVKAGFKDITEHRKTV